MKKHTKIWLGALFGLATITAATGWYLRGRSVPVLQTAGEIADKQRNLLIACALLSVLVVVPVFWLLTHFAYKYSERNASAQYDPDQHGNNAMEVVWWLIPTLLMVVISTITWRSSYAMDPYKPLASKNETLHVQVVAMDWKWLFIYPDQKVASVNEAAIPVDTPVDFEITSDTVMSSFWVPSLGGQMYAMTGMNTHLNLQASKPGDYRGSAANVSGKGFADMKFTVRAVSDDEFASWLGEARRADVGLSQDTYAMLARPGVEEKPSYYSSIDTELYDTIVMKYMMPTGQTETHGDNH